MTFWGSQPTDHHIFICVIQLCLRIPREINSGYGFLGEVYSGWEQGQLTRQAV